MTVINKLLIIGANGKMGRAVYDLAEKNNHIKTIVPLTPKDISFENLFFFFKEADAVIDFSSADSAAKHATIATVTKTPLLIGTTIPYCIPNSALQHLLFYCESRNYVQVMPNTALGMVTIMETIGQFCSRLSGTWHCTITNIHDLDKKENISGTAQELQNIISHKLTDYDPCQNTSKRVKGSCGEHILTFTNGQETITITHKVKSRDVYAEGAITSVKRMLENINIKGGNLNNDQN